MTDDGASAPTLSVITITRDDLPGLEATVESVRAQQGVDLEHIVIDANSADGTRGYLKQLAADTERHSYQWVSEPDLGRYDGMNKGAKLARGKYLWFMHSTDVFSGAHSARQGVDALQCSGAHWGYGLSRMISGGNVVGIAGAVPFRRTSFLTGKKIIPHQASLLEREFFWRLGGFGEQAGVADDQRLFMAALKLGEPAVVADFLCDFDASGVGTLRPVTRHFLDIAALRRQEHVSITGSLPADLGLTTALIIIDWAKRQLMRRAG